MVRHGDHRSSRRSRRMRVVGGVVTFLAAGRRRRTVLSFLQKLPKVLDRLVQRPELRQQREVQLSETEHFPSQDGQLRVEGCELPSRWRGFSTELRRLRASLRLTGGSCWRWWRFAIVPRFVQIKSAQAPRQRRQPL